MGRKPNALIIQYFDRGVKLQDSSNRYQHTCKACGEKFPKGRIDSLTTHLVKRCPALSIQDRQNALLQLNDLPNIDLTHNNNHAKRSSTPSTVGLSVVPNNWTALETLAEVSRQFDMSEKHDVRSMGDNRIYNDREVSRQTSAPRLELHEQYTLENPPISHDRRIHRGKRASILKINQNKSNNSQSLLFPDSSENSCSASPGVIVTNLGIDESNSTVGRFMTSMVDPQLLGNDSKTQSSICSEDLASVHCNISTLKTVEQALNETGPSFIPSMGHQSAENQKLKWPIVEYSRSSTCFGTQNFDCVAENAGVSGMLVNKNPTSNLSAMTTEFSAEYGNGQKTNKPKVRGRFSSSRRKEVQEVRKKGACIRCRMLKKPCSEDTPCNTCKNVESARLWKTPCIRTRVADELEMYSSGLHAVIAHQQINNAKTIFNFQPSLQRIEASHYPETTIFATFNSLEGHGVSPDGNIDPCLNEHNESIIFRILDYETDDLPSKLETYAKRISRTFYEQEPSKFMHTTLNFAQELASAKQDYLLARTLELWTIVHILVDHEISWRIAEKMTSNKHGYQDLIIDQSCSNGVYGLICSQLSAAAETKASGLCKIVLNELERRLLQRSAAESFETFLAVLITLNCFEKSTWLFKSWEHESFKYRWPLDKTPGSIYSQGDKLADLLLMLLRMRNVPPKTYTRPEDGILASDATPIACEYYKKLNLSYVHVLSKQADYTYEPTNSRCYELRYCSRLLLPIT
ncbi:putative zn 2cys6 transcription factor protein [Erysiphe necator]|uniref:Putative zn 2cys6 transcription factor protein n=1 Tax=Uncinula necator TaxID=52586 RepID=A0A0B1PG16_UNCNE|nr:putative zn 2cys6 transcription factor protein [Erysiphe necator]